MYSIKTIISLSKPAPARMYLLAILAVALAALVRYFLTPMLGDSVPFLTFILAIVASAVYGGFVPALLATGLSAIASGLLFVEPYFSFSVPSMEDQARLLLFVGTGVAISLVGGRLHVWQQASHESEERFRLLAQGARDTAILFLSPEGKVESWNTGAERIKGYRAEEIIGRSFSTFYTEEDRAAGLPQSLLEKAKKHGQIQAEGWRVRKDGAHLWAELDLIALYDEHGKLRGFSKLVRDRTEQRKLLLSLQQSESELLRERSQIRSVLDNAPVLVSIKDLNGNVLLINRCMADTLGLPQDQIIGRSIFELFPEEDAQKIWDSDLQALQASKPIHSEDRLLGKDGLWYTYLTVKYPVSYLNTSEPFGICTFSMDITEQKKAEEKLLHAAQHDPLTGLPNRGLVYEFSNHLINTAKRSGKKLAVLFCDLDRFKPINDTYGHETGDKMLKEVARRLNSNVRGSDLVGRLGGDEFVAILTNVQTEQDVVHVAGNLLEALRQPYLIGHLELLTSPSIGISMYPDDGKSIDALIRCADAAMYHAKENGRNNFQFFTPEINANTERVFSVEQRMRQSIHAQEFELYYQPIIDTATNEVVGVEALLRWPQQNGEILAPGEFISAAETSGLIHPLGDWIIGEACRQHQAWRKQGLPPIRIAVNVSPVQFRTKDFGQHVAHAVQESGIDPSCLELEVTESMVMKQGEQAAQTLSGLKALGLQISLDDFGTGYSSLSHLTQLPIDKLKVDQSFIRNIHTDSRSLAITETVIALGKKLGVKVVAEGIESEEVLELLRSRHCDLGQGYLVSVPMRADKFADWHRTHESQATYH